jgi:pimeloyl-ACP methyl ester carboxylesterase
MTGNAAHQLEEALGPADRVQRAVSADGTEIAGHVFGQGPPLVLVHGGLGSRHAGLGIRPPSSPRAVYVLLHEQSLRHCTSASLR